jgi:Fic family protein
MSARNKKRKNRVRGSRAGAAKRRPSGRSGGIHTTSRRRSRPASRAADRARARARLLREKTQKQAKQAREKKAKALRLKREKAQKLARLKREKALKLLRSKREKAQKLARLKREREARLLAQKRKRDEALRKKEAKQRELERVRARRESELEKKRRARERELEAIAKKREKAKAEKERARQKALREAERAREKRAAEQRRIAEKQARETERRRLVAEREAAKEAARRAKEEERARRDAEREAYRKAKEAERERLRAEREAARRLREGKVARATRAAQRVDGLRVGTTRVYDPSSIPNQSGTTRRVGELPQVQRLVGVRPAAETPSSASGAPPPATAAPRPTPPPPPAAATIEQRYRRILDRLATASDALKKEYEETLEMSWIHHDSALEGVVYTFQELRAAMDPTPAAVADSSLQPVCEEIRRHRQAIAYVRDLGERRRVPLNVDSVKKLYVMLHPEEGDVKTVKYRKDIPQHRLYFHEYTPPDKIAYRVRQIMDWLNGPEAKKMKNPLRVAARVHYDLVRVFPFPNDSGKVARLIMNVVLLRGGYPPAIIHSTERQRYYEALKGQLPVIVQLVNESILNALTSIEKRLDDEERQAS